MTQDADERRADVLSRIDEPHSIDGDRVAHANRVAVGHVVAAAAGDSSPHVAEQIRLQASQLADHLRGRLRELDQRESELNARIAELENELRLSRLWLGEREHDFAERESQLQQQLADLQQRVQLLSTKEVSAEQDHARREQELSRRERKLSEREQRLAERQTQLIKEAESLRAAKEQLAQQQAASSAALVTERRQLDEQRQSLAARRQQNESELQASARVLEESGRQLVQQREAFQREESERARMLDERRTRLEREWAEAQRVLVARREQLDRREAALSRLYGAVVRRQRENLRVRLAAEELWSQQCQQPPPTEGTATLSSLRLQLADQIRLAREEWRAQRRIMTELAAKLAMHCERLRQQRPQADSRGGKPQPN